MQSDTSIESEDSFASVIYIPRPDHNGSDPANNIIRIPSVPTSPLIMPCPTPAHSPAPQRYKLGTTFEESSKFVFETEKLQNIESNVVTIPGQVDSPNPSNPQSTGKITKYDVKNMPSIPKFRKSNSCHSSTRAGRFAVPAVPKFISLELYNPETDDLDSDSSEPSSPDSIDSVINALKPTNSEDNSSMDGPKINTNGSKDNIYMGDIDTTDGTAIELCLPNNEFMPESDLIVGSDCNHTSANLECQQQLVDFAEQLSAQLLKELNKDSESSSEKSQSNSSLNQNCPSGKLDGPITINLDESCFIRRITSEHRNLNTLREELRERRLMLANLKSHHYPNSSNSTSSTIHEEDEISPTQTSEHELELDHFISKNEYDSNREHYGGTKNVGSNLAQHLIVNSDDNLELCNDSDSMGEGSNGATNTNSLTESLPVCGGVSMLPPETSHSHRRAIDARKNVNVDSWTHSNSTVSLDSPSAGGASTHHRYYHVFREGELDSLINHHVASLHIVSSYYERASWCVVAEKVQVWTI